MLVGHLPSPTVLVLLLAAMIINLAAWGMIVIIVLKVAETVRLGMIRLFL